MVQSRFNPDRNQITSVVYSTDHMQGIRRMNFDRILNEFITSDECVYHWRRTRLLLVANAFIASDERFQHWRRTRLQYRAIKVVYR